MNTSPAQFLALCTVLALSLVTAVHPAVAQSVAQSAAPLLLPPSLVPQITINALMKDTIDPAASALWTAVSYTATVEGITETMPETEEDWNALRARADELIKAGALLMLPGLKVNDLSAKAVITTGSGRPGSTPWVWALNALQNSMMLRPR